MAAKNIKVTLVKSLAGQLKNISASVRGLGLRSRTRRWKSPIRRRTAA